MKNRIFIVLVLSLSGISCVDDPQPKPKGYLSLTYPDAIYRVFDPDCPYIFDINLLSVPKTPRGGGDCAINIHYELLDGTIFLTYQPVQGNLDSLLRDAQRLPLQHTIKADAIEGDKYTNAYNDTYGMFYEVSGDAASQAQFYLTDSVHHFLTGSVYFDARPNYDSIKPAAAYLKKDIRHLMETVRWKEQE